MDRWEGWDPVMQDDYLAEIDLSVGDELVLEIRRKVLDATSPKVSMPKSQVRSDVR